MAGEPTIPFTASLKAIPSLDTRIDPFWLRLQYLFTLGGQGSFMVFIIAPTRLKSTAGDKLFIKIYHFTKLYNTFYKPFWGAVF